MEVENLYKIKCVNRYSTDKKYLYLDLSRALLVSFLGGKREMSLFHNYATQIFYTDYNYLKF